MNKNMKKVGIINFKTSNLTSVYNAVEYLGYKVAIIEKNEDFKEKFTHYILPGVGSFKEGMQNIKQNKLDVEIKMVANNGLPLFGICLGMQVLAEYGEEFGHTEGLGLVRGSVEKISFENEKLRLPHIGWNNVEIKNESSLWNNISSENSFYFIHSYVYKNISDKNVIGISNYGSNIVVAIQNKNVYGVQFHPEKSQKDGLKLLKNFIELC